MDTNVKKIKRETLEKENIKKLSKKQKCKYKNAKKLSKYFHLMRVWDGLKNPKDSGWGKPTTKETNDILKELERGEEINYGLVMLKDFIAIDLDHIYDEETYPKYCDFYEKYNLDTIRVRTPSMGYHFIFKMTEYAFNRMKEIGKNSLQDKNLAGWVDTRHGNGYVVGPGCTVEKDAKYVVGGANHDNAFNEYKLEVNKEPAYISNDLVDFIIEEKQKDKDTKRAKKGKTKKTVINNSNKNEEKEKPEKEVSKKEKQRRQHLKKVVEEDLLTEEEINTIDKIVNLINREHLRDYYDALYICFSLGSLGYRLFDVCINLMKRADENLEKGEGSKFSFKWVKDNFNKNKKAFFNEPLSGNHMTIDYALWLAGVCNGEKKNTYIRDLLKKQKTNNLNLEEEFNIDENVKETMYPSKLEEKKDVVVNEYEDEYVEQYPINDYDIILMRSRMGGGKTTALKKALDEYQPKNVLIFSCRIIYAYNKCEEFKDYDFYNYKELKEINGVNNLFCSLESLHKINEDTKFDLIIMDELETILNTFDGDTITKSKKKEEIKEKFNDFLKSCNKIICNDAFLGNRGLEFMRLMRNKRNDDKKIYLSLNNQKPDPREALIVKNQYKFEHMLKKDLEAGKKIIFHSSSKRAQKRICNNLEECDYSVLHYHADMSDKVKMETATNVDKSWTDYVLVAYTPSITTGLSFMDFKYFDKKYFLGVSGSALVRDSIQALDRARKCKEEKLIIHFINDHNDINKFFLSKDNSIKQRFNYEIEEIKRLRKKYHREKEDGIPQDWEGLINFYNEKERKQTDGAYSKVFLYYLEAINYNITFDKNPTKEELNKMETLDAKVDFEYEDIPPITGQLDFDKLTKKVEGNKATAKEKAMYKKAYFLKFFLIGENAKNSVNTEDFKKLWECWCDDKKKGKLLRLQDELKGLSEDKLLYHLEKENVSLRPICCYDELKDVLRVLGLSDTTDDSKTFSFDDFNKIKEELQPLINKLFKKLNIQDKYNTKDFKRSEGEKICNDLNRILECWSGSKFKKEKKITRRNPDGTRGDYSTYKLHNLVGLDKHLIKNQSDKVNNNDNSFRDRNIFNVLGKGNGNR